MPRRPVTASNASLSLVLCASLASQTAFPARSQSAVSSDNQGPRATASPGNPVLDSQQTLAAQFTPNAQQHLPDYRPLRDPELQRQPRDNERPLSLYGYDFFEPARQVISARRSALERAMSGGRPSRQTQRDSTSAVPQGRPHAATPEELETVRTLGDAQKGDLLQRQRAGLLTEDEKQQYRLFLYPSTYESRRPASRDEVEAIQALTPEQKADLLTRLRVGTLGDRERSLYRILLYPMPERLPVSGTLGTGEAISAPLTAEQKVDLLTRQRDGTLTDAEKQKYHGFLYPNRYRQDPGTSSADDRNGTPAPDSDANDSDTPYFTSKPAKDDTDLPSDPQPQSRPRSSTRNSQPAGSTAPGQQGAPQWPGSVTDDNSAMPPGAGDFSSESYAPPATGPDYTGDLDYTAPGGDYAARTGASYGTTPGTLLPQMDMRPGMDGTQDGRRFDTSSPNLPPVNAYNQIADPLATTLQQVVASAPTDYQLSGGDRVTLHYSSPTMAERQSVLTVDPQGGIAVPGIGRVVVRGMTTDQAERALQSRMRGYYRNVNVSLFLDSLRTIPVTVSGASFFPGTYQVPAVATAFNVLYATGGPTSNGSLRRIEVRRRGALVGTLDVYKFLSGSQARDIPLQSGDVIVILEHLSRVGVRGEVRHAAVYELSKGEGLADALRYAGGIKPSGVSQKILVSTLQPGSARILKNVDATQLSAARTVSLYDGDSVDVFSVRDRLANKVTIEGAVDQPGDYAATDGMTVSDLVESARGLLSEAYTRRADLWRFNPDTSLTLVPIDLDKALAHDPSADLKLTRWDKLKVYSLGEVTFMGRRDVIVNGAVQHPGVYYRGDNMRVKDLLLQAGGTLPDAYTYRAALLHQNPDGTYKYQFVNLASAMTDSPDDNLPLQDHDVLGIYKVDEAQFVPKHTFSIKGEVVAPGDIYPRGDGMRLSDAVKLAGGLLPSAGDQIAVAHARQNGFEPPALATFSAQTGAVSPDLPLQDGDVVTIQGRGSWVDHPYVVTVKGAVNKPGPVILPQRHVRLSEVVKLAGGLKPEAFPEGAEFDRLPENLTSDQQKKLSTLIERVNELLNSSEYKRALAQSDVERIKAIGKATSSQGPVGIPGFGTVPGDSGAAAAAAASSSPLNSRDLVTPPRDLTPMDLQPAGNVAVNLDIALKRPGTSDDILMTDGDTVIVPEVPTTVQVVGAVINARGVVFKPGEKPSYYLDRSGGFAPDAAKDRVLVIQVGGGLVPIKKVKAIRPGDTILVPTGVMAAKISNHQSEFDSIFKSLTNSALVFFVAKKLIGF